MRLSEQQRLFTKLQSEWACWCFSQGYELTDGDAYRDPRTHGKFGKSKAYGNPKSLHKVRLARDYNLFIGGKYKNKSKDYRVIGEKWESMHPLNRWGGRFGDGNHFSMTLWGLS